MIENYWSEFEYSKYKLLLNYSKIKSIRDKLAGDTFLITPPISVELHLTDICNLNCEWCTDINLRENKSTLEKNTIFAFFEYCALNKVGVTLEGGGEPTLHKKFYEIVSYGADLGLDMGLITNGIRDISDLAHYFKWIRISLDSSTPKQYLHEKGKDNFDKVMNNIESISSMRDSSKTHVGVGYVVTKRNIRNIDKLIPILDNLNVDYVYIRPVEESLQLTPDVRNLNKLNNFLEEYCRNNRIKFILSVENRMVKKNNNLPCVGHSLTSLVQANGDVVLCEKRRHDKIVLGNINKSNYRDIWSSSKHHSVSNKLLNKEQQIGCEVCRITPFNELFVNIDNLNTKSFI